MIKVVAMYRKPKDTKDFDEKYFGTHVPLTNKLPGLKKVEISKVTSSSVPGDDEWYLVADLYFDTKEDMDKAMSSPEAKEARANIRSFAGDLLYVLNTEIQKVPAPAGK